MTFHQKTPQSLSWWWLYLERHGVDAESVDDAVVVHAAGAHSVGRGWGRGLAVLSLLVQVVVVVCHRCLEDLLKQE